MIAQLAALRKDGKDARASHAFRLVPVTLQYDDNQEYMQHGTLHMTPSNPYTHLPPASHRYAAPPLDYYGQRNFQQTGQLQSGVESFRDGASFRAARSMTAAQMYGHVQPWEGSTFQVLRRHARARALRYMWLFEKEKLFANWNRPRGPTAPYAQLPATQGHTNAQFQPSDFASGRYTQPMPMPTHTPMPPMPPHTPIPSMPPIPPISPMPPPPTPMPMPSMPMPTRDLTSRVKQLEAQIEAATAAGDYTTANALLKEQTTVEQLMGSVGDNENDPEAAAKETWLARLEQR